MMDRSIYYRGGANTARRTKLARALLVSAIAVGFVAAAPTSAIADDASSKPLLYVVTTGSQTIEEGIAAHAANDPDYRESAISLTDVWLDRLRAGEAVGGLDGTAETQLASVSDLQSKLKTGDLPSTEIFSPGTATPSLQSTQHSRAQSNGEAAVAASDPSNPNSFDVRGEANYNYWTDMGLSNALEACDGFDCWDTDRFDSSVTVNPGAVSSVVTANNSYFPNSGNFGNKHFELWSINFGNIDGNDNTGDLPNSSWDPVYNWSSLNNSAITVGVTQWVYVNPFGGYIADSAKTADAWCGAAPDNACYY
jgi:hypothetical protein